MDERALERSLAYLKDWLRFRYEREDIPGFVVAVAVKGKILFNEAYGYADLEKRTKLTPQHLFRIASHSKTFTATAIMQLQEQGKLEIDEPIVKYLPWLKSHRDKRFLKVTIRQLLSHGAGVIRDGLDQDYWALERLFPDEKRFKADILEAELILKPNLKMKYSNYGYTLLGFVIEAASGLKYNDYVVKNIVKPLALKNTGPEFSKAIESKLVTGYSRTETDRKRLPIAQLNTMIMSPATGFYSTAEDLCVYFNAHLPASGQLLSDKSKRLMQRKVWRVENSKDKDAYGLGLAIERVNSRNLYGHGGGFPGHSTQSLFDLKRQLVVIVLTNAMHTRPSFINRSIVKVIDAFQSHANTNNRLRKYEARFMSFWSIYDIVAANKKLIAANPSSWEPFDMPDELTHVSGDTFKITKTSSYGSEGELAHFNFDKRGKLKSMVISGEKMLPEKDYLREIFKKKGIG